MAKTIVAPLQAHLDAGSKKLAFGLKITRRDGMLRAYTSATRDKVIGGVRYRAAPGPLVASFRSQSGLAVGSNILKILEADDDFTRLEVLEGRWDGAAFDIFQFNWDSPSDGTIPFASGTLGNVVPERRAYGVELRDHRQQLQQVKTWIFQEGCRNRFGDDRCAVDASTYTVTGAVTTVVSQREFIDAARTEAADWLGYGTLEWLTGLNSGLTVKIRTFAEPTQGGFVLDTQMFQPIAEGDTYAAIAGCRGRFYADCRDKFANVLNFNGEPGKPTLDAIAAPPPETPLAPPPAPAPTPAPAPPPSAPGTRPMVVMVDYTQTYDAASVALHAKADLSIRGFTTGNAAAHGTSWPAAVLAINPNWQLGNYVILNELQHPQTAAAQDYYPLWLEVVARDWWAWSNPAHVRTQWTTLYNKYEINPTRAAPVNGAGERLSQYKAEHFDFPFRFDDIPEATWVFIDNFWSRPAVTADYNRDNVNESRDAAAAAWQLGYSDYVAALKALRPGLKIVANVNHTLSAGPYSGLCESGFVEGLVGRSYGVFAASGMSGVRTRLLGIQANTIDGLAILQAYVETGDYPMARMAYTMAAINGAGICLTDSTPQIHAWHIDEMYVAVGARVGAVPIAATANGIWSNEYEQGLFLCNPTLSAATIDVGLLWKHIDAAIYDNQQPAVNTGADATIVTVPARDGRLLIRR